MRPPRARRAEAVSILVWPNNSTAAAAREPQDARSARPTR